MTTIQQPGQQATKAREGAAAVQAAQRQPHQPALTQDSQQDETSAFAKREEKLRRGLENPLMGTLAEVVNVQQEQHGNAEAAKAAVKVDKLDAIVVELTDAKKIKHIRDGEHVLQILRKAEAEFPDGGFWTCTNTAVLEAAARTATRAAKGAAKFYPDLRPPADLLMNIVDFYEGLGLHRDWEPPEGLA